MNENIVTSHHHVAPSSENVKIIITTAFGQAGGAVVQVHSQLFLVTLFP